MNEIRVRELLDRYGLSTAKSLGQNFLRDLSVLETIADAAGEGGNILEIGAGVGTLTSLLSKKAKKAVTIEIDRHLEPLLIQEVPAENHRFIWSDILKCDLAALQKELFGGERFTVVGNLPYYITTEILSLLFASIDCWDKAVLMVQKEVAQRLLCAAGTKEYRALSVITRAYCEGELLLEVPPHCFVPAPHVHSAVMVLEPKANRPDEGFVSFVQSGFAARRKMLCSSPAFKQRTGLDREGISVLLKAAGLPENARGEQFSFQEWIRLYELAQNMN
ncbi:MAG: ribosomal RNA small subunit methyltransferase A [Clostridia bacterium]|nr:ribosomal RNA small subunit methyltransferase A [Clostridia bacterium]